jgi:hypothetical protein
MPLFKVDENLPAEVADLLRAAGHDAVSVLDQQLGGAADPRVATACQREERALITLDLGFGDIRSYGPGPHPLRLPQGSGLVTYGKQRRRGAAVRSHPLHGQWWLTCDASLNQSWC